MRAAYEQGRILLGRRQIESVLTDTETPNEDKEKLAYVLKAREFATTIGLTPGDSFTAYSDIGKDTLAWIVVASKKDGFIPYTWWFPIVGTVPYKGFFNQTAAVEQAKKLESQGYESSVRGTEAFSTLGWFNDPVLSTTLRNPTFKIVNTVLHESVHATVWIPNNVPFNETLASFVGNQATVEFFKQDLFELSSKGSSEKATTDSQQNLNKIQGYLAASERDSSFQSEFAGVITKLYNELNQLYLNRSISTEDKLTQRTEVFNRCMMPFKSKYPRMTVLLSVNNAEIMQFMIYMTKYEIFEQLFIRVGQSWSNFFKEIQKIQKAVESEPLTDPFDMLEKAPGSSKELTQ